ncbi:DUF5065 family protein [Bacillus toyonensis]|nr:DUF5065 family protein [Bacillus toyonensis]
MDGVPKNKNKNLLVLIYLSLGLNLITAPLALFIGGMTTDPPGSTELDFLKGFLFIQAIPLFLLFIFLAWYFIRKNKTMNWKQQRDYGSMQNVAAFEAQITDAYDAGNYIALGYVKGEFVKTDFFTINK